MKVVKCRVCVECYGNMYATDCVCAYQKHETVDLEFQWCECCDRRYDYPMASIYNREQIKNIEKL